MTVLVSSGLIAATPAHSADLSPAPDGGSGTTNVGSPENQPASSPEVAQGQGIGMMLGGVLAVNAQAAQTDDKVGLTFGTGMGAGITAVTYSETGVPPSSNFSVNSNVGLGVGRFGVSVTVVDNSLGQRITTVTFPGHDGKFAFGLNSTSITTITDKKTGEVSTAITNSISQGKSIGANSKVGIAASVLVNANVVYDKFTGKVVVDEENLAFLRSVLEKLDFRQVDNLVNDFKAMNLYDVIDQKFDAKKAQELRELFGLGPIPGPEPSPFRSPPMPEPNPFGPAAPAAPDKASLGEAEVAGGPGSALGPGGVSPADPSSPAGGAAAASGGHTSAGDASDGVDSGVAGGPGSSLGPGGVSPADPSSPAGGAAAASGGHTSAGDASDGVDSGVAGGPGSSLGPGGVSPADSSSPAGGAAAASGGHTSAGDASDGVDSGVAGGPGSSLGPGGVSPADSSSPAGGAAAASGGHTDSVSSDASDGVGDGVTGASDASDGVGAGDSGDSNAGDGGVGAGSTGDGGMAGGTSGAGDGSGSDGGGMGSDGGASGF